MDYIFYSFYFITTQPT